jgi:GNAT superfamily N-acetyltransferase
MTAPLLFQSADLRARELAQGEVARLQAFYDASPEYFMAINGRPPGPSAAQEEFDDLPPPELGFSRRWMVGLFDPSDTLAGIAVVLSDFCAARVWHIGLFLIATPLRGTGAAGRIYDALEGWMHRSGAAWLRLGVVVGNGAGERFWQKCGYREVRLRKGLDTGGRLNDVRVLVKPLVPQAELDTYLALVARDRVTPADER